MQWQGIDVGQRVALVIDAGHVDVVDVEQQAATGAADDLADEVGFVQGRALELQISGGVFQQHRALEPALYLVDVFAYPVQGAGVVGQGQQVVEKHRAVAGPRQVFGKRLGLIAFDQRGQACQVLAVQGAFAADGQADAVQ